MFGKALVIVNYLLCCNLAYPADLLKSLVSISSFTALNHTLISKQCLVIKSNCTEPESFFIFDYHGQ